MEGVGRIGQTWMVGLIQQAHEISGYARQKTQAWGNDKHGAEARNGRQLCPQLVQGMGDVWRPVTQRREEHPGQ